MKIRLFISVTLLICFCTVSTAQTTNSRGIYTNKAELEDIEMGWMNRLEFKSTPKAVSLNGWNYPANQVAASEKIAGWILETYSPVTGLLGEIRFSTFTPEASRFRGTNSFDFNEWEKDNRLSLPNSYGALAKFHFCLSKTKEHKFWPTPGHHCNSVLEIMANSVELVTQQIVSLSSTTEYYCTMPVYTIGQKGKFDNEYNRKFAEYRNFTASQNLKNYQHFFNPADLQRAYIIIMTKDGKPLPLEQVTVAQFISRLENQFPLLHKQALNQNLIYENYLENAKKGIQVLKAELKNRMADFVYLSDINQQINIVDLANIGSSGTLPYWLSFEQNTDKRDEWGKVITTNTNYPLLRLKKGVKEACATGGPQWIVFRLTNPEDHSYGGYVRLMDNFVSHFNYEYLYNYFFGKEKPTGAYTSLKPTGSVASGKKQESPATLSSVAQKKSADKSILFFEDFSSVNEGSAPAHWNTTRSGSGDQPQVVSIQNNSGKWLKLTGNASPKKLSLPLAGDFELNYDLLVHKGDVPWGTPGIDLQMDVKTSTGIKNYIVNVTPGDMNRNDAAGWISLTLGGMQGCKLSGDYSVPEFTGSKPVNKATITVRRKGGEFAVLCNNKKVYECNTGFPPGSSLEKMQFSVSHKNTYYLGNIEMKRI